MSSTLRKFPPIAGLRHVTTIESLINILRYGNLFTWKEIQERKEITFVGLDFSRSEASYPATGGYSSFPGVYFTTILDFQLGKYASEERRHISVIVDPYVLNRYDYHINPRDMYGEIDPGNTYSRPSIDELLPRLEKDYKIGEIVFHNRISIDFIKAILVSDELGTNWLLSKLRENGLDKYSYLVKNERYQSAPYYETDEKILKSPAYLALANASPSNPMTAFCTSMIGEPITSSVMAKTLINCGQNPHEMRSKICKDKNLDNCENELYYSFYRVKGVTHYPAVYFPPLSGPLNASDMTILSGESKTLSDIKTVIVSEQITGIYGRVSILDDLLDILIEVSEGSLQDSRELRSLKEAITLLYSGNRAIENNPIIVEGIIGPYNTDLKSPKPIGLEAIIVIWAREKDSILRDQLPQYVKVVKGANDKTMSGKLLLRIQYNQLRYTSGMIRRVSNMLAAVYKDKAADMMKAESLVSKVMLAL